jgi:dihydroxyacetone kinase-like protein
MPQVCTRPPDLLSQAVGLDVEMKGVQLDLEIGTADFLDDLSLMFTQALEQIKARGGASPGDKTLIDALEPAIDALKSSSEQGHTLSSAFRIAAEKAREGAEATRSMVGKRGRSKNLGERGVGYIDPGAVSTALIFGVICDYIQGQP